MANYKVEVREKNPWQIPVADRVTVPAGGESKGDRYLVIATASGDFTGHENDIAQYNGSTWDFYTPVEGWITWVKDEDTLYRFDGSSWTANIVVNKLALTNATASYDDITTFNRLFTFQSLYSGVADNSLFYLASSAGKRGIFYVCADGGAGTWSPYLRIDANNIDDKVVLGSDKAIELYTFDDLDDYIRFQTIDHIPEITTVGACDFKINAGGSNDLLLNHSGGKVGIGTLTPNEQLELTGNIRLPATTATTGIYYSGANLLMHTYGTTGNLFMGIGAGNLTNTSSFNVGIGKVSLSSLGVGGNHNVAVGFNSLPALITGDENVAIGKDSMRYSTASARTVAIGFKALEDVTASDNIAVGAYALGNTSNSSGNIAVGVGAMYVQTTGSNYNTAVGFEAARNGTARTNCLFLGYRAGYYETASNKLFIDTQTRASEADGRVKALIYGIFNAAIANQSITINGKLNVNSDVIGLKSSKTPASAGATGSAGDICWDADYIYICVATDTWKRAAMATW